MNLILIHFFEDSDDTLRRFRIFTTSNWGAYLTWQPAIRCEYHPPMQFEYHTAITLRVVIESQPTTCLLQGPISTTWAKAAAKPTSRTIQPLVADLNTLSSFSRNATWLLSVRYRIPSRPFPIEADTPPIPHARCHIVFDSIR